MSARPSAKTLEARGIDRWGFPVRTVGLVAAPAPVKVRTQRGLGSYVDSQILPGLQRLCAAQRPGESLSRKRIARECGVDKETIRNIERSALKKLRARLGPAAVRQLREMLSSEFQSLNQSQRTST